MANEQNQVAKIKAIPDKLEGVKVIYVGDTKVTEPAEQIEALRGYIRSSVLKQFGITSVNKTHVTTTPLGFNENNVQTKLKLPKPLTRLNGDWAESLADYYKRVMPTIQQWARNSVYNSVVSEELVKDLE